MQSSWKRVTDLPFGKIHGIQCEAFLDWLRGRTCLVHECRTPGEAMHVRTKQWGDIANAVPCCHAHHMESHTGQKTFEKEHDIDLTTQAAYFWYCFCMDGEHK